MRLPIAPDAKPLRQVSPSIYEALLRCRARAAWAASGDGRAVPQHPKAILGVCLHAVVEEAHKGALAGKDSEARLAAARQAFDRHAARLYREAHPLIRAKFSSLERLPGYNLYRERAALEASASAARVEPSAVLADSPPQGSLANIYAERKLVSQDGLLVGRPDLIDAATGEVVDYKTGASLEEAGGAPSPAEGRQLRLYIFLAHENALPASRAVIARADGQRASIEVSKAEADAEAQNARQLLAEYNTRLGATFQEIAQASAESCRFCPCIPFCEAFWQAALPGWSEQCGFHLEGELESVDDVMVQGVRLMTLRIRVQRGTLDCEEAFMEQVPLAWMTCDGSPAPQVGDLLRIVHARRAGEDTPAVVRVDRTATSVWTISRDQRAGG